MRPSSLGGDPPHLLNYPLPAKIKLRTALGEPTVPSGRVLYQPARRDTTARIDP
jgi:hypothetical protein